MPYVSGYGSRAGSVSAASDLDLISGADNGFNFNLNSLSPYDSMNYEAIINAGLMNYQHTLNTNSANAQMQFNASENEKTRNWIDEQRGNQYQTMVEDLKAAGLNPALAYSNGGAGVFSTSPASSSALGVSGSSVSNPFAQIASASINAAAAISNSKRSYDASLINSVLGLGGSALSALIRFM